MFFQFLKISFCFISIIILWIIGHSVFSPWRFRVSCGSGLFTIILSILIHSLKMYFFGAFQHCTAYNLSSIPALNEFPLQVILVTINGLILFLLHTEFSEMNAPLPYLKLPQKCIRDELNCSYNLTCFF